ncbi:hypothetical protein K1719_031526 [Acacia pycnantha]|nr:hypothetical protein K1719_031526 [Acacia pycnantha]
MESKTSELAYPVDGKIAVDLFVSTNHPVLPRGHLAFLDESNNLVFKINPHFAKPLPSNNYKKELLDASGEALLSIYRWSLIARRLPRRTDEIKGMFVLV